MKKSRGGLWWIYLSFTHFKTQFSPINNSRRISSVAFPSSCSSRARLWKTLRSHWYGFWQMLRWMDNPTFQPTRDLWKFGQFNDFFDVFCFLFCSHLLQWRPLFGILNRVYWRLEESELADYPSPCWWHSASLWCLEMSGDLWASTSRWIRGRFWCKDRAWRRTVQCQLCPISPERTVSYQPLKIHVSHTSF